MKNIIAVAMMFLILAGCKTVDVPKPVINIPPIVIGGNTVPVIPQPQQQGCGCDLTLPLDVPLVPEMGGNDKEVDANLYARWKAGVSDNCGGLPSDVRPLLIRPAGKTFGWKYVITEGAIKISVNGDKMTVWCGDYKGQRLHLIGTSDHESPNTGARPETLQDFVLLKSGVEGARKHFVYFECREVKQ